MSKITAKINFMLNKDDQLSDGIDDHTQISDYTFAEWTDFPSRKFLSVGEYFMYKEEQYVIDSIFTNLDIFPDLHIPDIEIGSDSVLTVNYFVSKV